MPTTVVYALDAIDSLGNKNTIAIDGSETIVMAGDNVTVTGTGTTGDPYVIASSGSTPAATPVILQARFASKTLDVTAIDITGYSSTPVETIAGSFNLATGKFTVPTAGWYRVAAKSTVNANWSSNQYVQINFVKNGANFSNVQSRVTGGNITLMFNGEAYVNCAAGDLLSLSAAAGQTATTSPNEFFNEFYVMKVN